MFTILKKKTIEVFCYTDKKIVNDLFKIKRSNQSYPQWWKALPKYGCPYSSEASMKGCYGFLEFYKQSFTMPLWCDSVLYTNNEGNVAVETALNSNTFYHPEESHKDFFNNNEFGLIKLMSPWAFETKSQLDFFTCGQFFDNFNLLQNVQIVPGVTNFFVNHSVNLFIILKKFQKPIFLNHSTPIRHFFPLTEKKVVFICEHNEKKYFELINSSSQTISFFNNMYQKIKILSRNRT